MNSPATNWLASTVQKPQQMTAKASQGHGTDKDRLQPALLDRLTDNEPTARSERGESVYVNERRLRNALLRDLGWLLNATNASTQLDNTNLQHAKRSVLNYGIPPLAGQLFSEMDWKDIQAALRTAILTFEPRILPETLVVDVLPSFDSLNHHNTLQFEIRCHFWSLPYPLELLLKSSLDLESGQVVLADMTA